MVILFQAGYEQLTRSSSWVWSIHMPYSFYEHDLYKFIFYFLFFQIHPNQIKCEALTPLRMSVNHLICFLFIFSS